MKRIISLAVFICMMVSMLASCQLSTIIPPVTTPAETTPAETTTDAATTTGTVEEKEPITYDYMGTDLTQFVTLGEYKGIEITDKRILVSDDMVSRYIDELLISADCFTKQRTGTIEEYMLVSMDYVGKVDGVAFEGGTDKDFVFLVSENADYISGYADRTMFIEGFAASMIGKDISAPFDINVKFPENYGNDLAGKDAVFTITINHILKADALSADNVKKLSDVENITIDDFIKQTKEELVAAYDESARESMNISIWEIILEKASFKALPDDYINEYYNSEYESFKSMADVYGMKIEDILAYYGYSSAEDLKEEIVYLVKQMIVLYQIVKVEELTIDDATYEDRLEELAEEIGAKVEELKSNYDKDYLLEYFYFEDVTDFLYTNAKLTSASGQ